MMRVLSLKSTGYGYWIAVLLIWGVIAVWSGYGEKPNSTELQGHWKPTNANKEGIYP